MAAGCRGPVFRVSRRWKRLALSRRLALVGLLFGMAFHPSCVQTKAYRTPPTAEIDRRSEYRKLGKRALAEERWDEARKFFGKLLELDSNDLEAHYGLAISSRETGNFSDPEKRQINWDESKKHFQWIISRDSLYQDVLFEYGRLLECRGEWREAIAVVQERIRLRPDRSEPRLALFRLYRDFISHTRQADAVAWLRQQSSELGRYFVGEALRRAGKLAEADSVFQRLLADTLAIPRQPIYLSLAHICYERDEPEAAERNFWRAVGEIGSALDAALVFEDVKTIVSDAELRAYRALQSDSARIAFFHRVWTKRDPTPAARVNVRLAEHYRRLLHAEKNYQSHGIRKCYGIHTSIVGSDTLTHLAFPNTYKLDHEFGDRGLIYIRHGPPDERAVTEAADLPGNESWRYWEDEDFPELIFHFFADKEDTMTGWRLGPLLTDTRMVLDRFDWGGVYERLLDADELDEWILLARMAKESRRSVRIGLTTDRHTWGKKMEPLEMPFSVAAFRGDSGRTNVEIYYGLPVAKLAKAPSVDKREFHLEAGLAVHDSAWRPVVVRLDTVVLQPFASPSLGDTAETILGLYRVRVKPDSYRVAFHARPLGTDLLGGWKLEQRFPDFSTPDPVVSDLVLADRVVSATGGGRFVKNGLQILPNPERRFQRGAPLWVYFEIYNLATDSAGRSAFTIDYRVTLVRSGLRGLKRILGFFGAGGRTLASGRFRRGGSGETAAEHFAIDLTGLRPGEYLLTVRVTDELTGEAFEVSTDMMIENRK